MPRKVLIVYLGNICRSPMAEGVLQAMAEARGSDWTIDSAGTGGWHQGDPPDPRAVRAAASRGYDISGLRARQFVREDFDTYDLILAMDGENLNDIERQRPSGNLTPLRKFMAEAGGANVPDPYYHGGFDRVLDMIETGAKALLDQEQ